MPEQSEADAPAATGAHPIDVAIAKRREEMAAESKASKSRAKAPASQEQPAETSSAADKANATDNGTVSDDGAAAANKEAEASLDADSTPDLSWLPQEFHSPQSRQGKKFLAWMKSKAHADKFITEGMQDLAKKRELLKADIELGETIRTKRPDIADIAYRLGKGESIQDIAASLKKDEPAPFSYRETDDEGIDKRVLTLAERVFKETEAAKAKEREMSEAQQAVVQQTLVSYVKDNSIDPDIGFAAIQSASAALAEDGLAWTAQNAERVLKRHLKIVQSEKAPGSNGSSGSGAPGLSKVASPTGLGVGVKSVPAAISAEARKRWANGQATDEERWRIFTRLPVSDRGQRNGAAGE